MYHIRAVPESSHLSVADPNPGDPLSQKIRAPRHADDGRQTNAFRAASVILRRHDVQCAARAR
ncbi:protein of unknown function (plasmid) [Paraburkholderia dioscoreae]|uniref:Uncharacterized protein n=1 Tax=Paraburkholderia dioscoreae TaxID=2604047 RepID=A0A5Q4ZIB8_9BURK|nr:protein of unknown function [Paraburkholderia dioscoreae]